MVVGREDGDVVVGRRTLHRPIVAPFPAGAPVLRAGVRLRYLIPVPISPHRRSCAIAVDVRAVGQARRFAAEALEGWERPDLVDTVALLVSEVVTNVVLHAGTPGELVIELADDAVRVEVRDGTGRLPQRKDYGDDASTGRGLALVELLADAWGAEPTEAGKRVWFQLRAPSLPVDDRAADRRSS